MRHKFGSLLILLISFCGGSEISNNEALKSSTTTTVTDLTTTTVTDSTTTSSTSTTTELLLSQTESYAQNNTLDQLVSNEMWNLFDADPPKSIYPEDLRKIEVLQTKLSDIYSEVQITSIYDEQTYQYHKKYCKENNITKCSLPYISDEHSYVTTTTTTTTTSVSPTITTQFTIPEPDSPDDKKVGEVNTFGTNDYNPTLLRDAGLISGDIFDTFVILLEIRNDTNQVPGPYFIRKGGNPCITEEGGCKVPDDFEEYLWIRGSFCSWDWELMEPTYTNSGFITTEGSNLVAKFYGCFEGESDFLLKIEPGATFRSYRTANPPAIVIEVDK